MPIKIKLVALLILISGFANAADKKDAFKKAVDYCNCRIANTYCKQYTDMKPESEEKVAYEKIETIFKCDISKSLTYDSVNNILKKNKFSEFGKKSSTVMSRILKQDVESLSLDEAVSKIISGIYESTDFKLFFTQYSEVGELKEPLTKVVKEYLSQSFGAIESPVTNNPNPEASITELQQELKRLESLIEERKTSPNTITWYLVLFIILSGATVYGILKPMIYDTNKRITDLQDELNKLSRNNNSNNSINSNKGQPPSQRQNENIDKFKLTIENKVSELNSAINKIQEDIDNLYFKVNTKIEIPQPISDPTQPIDKPQRIEILFAPIPNRDGSFNASKVTSTEDQIASFYKFTITDSLSQKATFEFLNVERAIKDATSSPELILNPVCKIKNALNQNAKRIKTVKPGTVSRRDDKWVVDQPAEIEYE
jgi:hypothetical protein